jgi:hypothetical protein
MNKHPNQFRDVLPVDEVLLEPSGQFGQDLRNFGAAVHRAAERQTSQPVPFGWLNAAKRRRRDAQRRLVLAWTCAGLLCVSALPLLHNSKTAGAPSHIVSHTAQPSTDDTALLEQVDTAISESVPSSLAPLAELDNWDATTSTNNEMPLNKPEKKHVSQ